MKINPRNKSKIRDQGSKTNLHTVPKTPCHLNNPKDKQNQPKV